MITIIMLYCSKARESVSFHDFITIFKKHINSLMGRHTLLRNEFIN